MAVDEDECFLLGDHTAWFVQILLGCISFSALVVKRFWETSTQRSWEAWCLDSSKQALGALLAHCVNIALAFMLAEVTDGDQCEWYLVSIVLDTTVGVGVAYVLLNMALRSGWAAKFDLGSRSQYGYYGSPASLRIWSRQLVLWLVVLMGMKVIMVMFMISLSEVCIAFSQLILHGLDDQPLAKLLVVMVAVPVSLNAFQYWVTDNFIQGRKSRHRRTEEYLMGPRDNVGSAVAIDVSRSLVFLND